MYMRWVVHPGRPKELKRRTMMFAFPNVIPSWDNAPQQRPAHQRTSAHRVCSLRSSLAGRTTHHSPLGSESILSLQTWRLRKMRLADRTWLADRGGQSAGTETSRLSLWSVWPASGKCIQVSTQKLAGSESRSLVPWRRPLQHAVLVQQEDSCARWGRVSLFPMPWPACHWTMLLRALDYSGYDRRASSLWGVVCTAFLREILVAPQG